MVERVEEARSGAQRAPQLGRFERPLERVRSTRVRNLWWVSVEAEGDGELGRRSRPVGSGGGVARVEQARIGAQRAPQHEFERPLEPVRSTRDYGRLPSVIWIVLFSRSSAGSIGANG